MAVSKQKHFINTVVNELYVDKSDEMAYFEKYITDVRKYACNNDSLTTSNKDTYSFITIKDKDTPALLLSKAAKKENAISLCNYTQCILWECNADTIKSFDDIVFSAPFLSEAQVDAYASGNAELNYESGEDNILAGETKPLEINDDALKAVISAVLLRWLMGTKQVKIAVPKTEEKYNLYVMRAVKEIYSYFPSMMKMEVGFTSYLAKSKQKDFPRFYIIFVPEAEADTETIFLDGSTPSAYIKYLDNSTIKLFRGFLDHIVVLKNHEERTEFLEKVFSDIEFGKDGESLELFRKRVNGFDAMQYKNYSGAIAILDSKESNKELLPSWIDFAVKGLPEFPKMEEMLWEKINNELQSDELNSYAAETIKNCGTAASVVAEIKTIAKVCRDHKEMLPGLWTVVENQLSSGIYSDESVCKVLESNKTELQELSSDSSQMRTELEERCAADLLKKAEEKADKAADEKLLKKDYLPRIKAITGEIKNSGSYLPETIINNLDKSFNLYAYNYLLKKIEAKIDSLNSAPTKLPSEMNARIAEIEKLKVSLEPEEDKAYIKETDAYASLEKKLDEGIQLERGKLQASSSVLQSVKDELGKGTYSNYFKKLETACSYFDQLELEHVANLKEFLRLLMPQTYEEYNREFKLCYGADLKGTSISRAPAEVQRIIIDDAKVLYAKRTFKIEGTNATEIQNAVAAAKAQMAQFAPDKEPRLEYCGLQCTARDIEKILNLTATGENGFIRELAEAFVNNGIFKGNQMISLRNMYEECNVKGKDMLVRAAIEGKFTGADKTTYKRFFEDYVRYAGSELSLSEQDALKRVENLKRKCETVDKLADSAIEEIRKDIIKREQESKAGKKPGKVIAIVTLAVLLAGAAGYGVKEYLDIKSLKAEKSNTEDTLSNTQNALKTRINDLYTAQEEIRAYRIEDAYNAILTAVNTVTNMQDSAEIETAIEIAKEKTAYAIAMIDSINNQANNTQSDEFLEAYLKEDGSDEFLNTYLPEAMNIVNDAFNVIENEFAGYDGNYNMNAEGLDIIKSAFEVAVGKFDYTALNQQHDYAMSIIDSYQTVKDYEAKLDENPDLQNDVEFMTLYREALDLYNMPEDIPDMEEWTPAPELEEVSVDAEYSEEAAGEETTDVAIEEKDYVEEQMESNPFYSEDFDATVYEIGQLSKECSEIKAKLLENEWNAFNYYYMYANNNCESSSTSAIYEANDAINKAKRAAEGIGDSELINLVNEAVNKVSEIKAVAEKLDEAYQNLTSAQEEMAKITETQDEVAALNSEAEVIDITSQTDYWQQKIDEAYVAIEKAQEALTEVTNWETVDPVFEAIDAYLNPPVELEEESEDLESTESLETSEESTVY